MTGWYARLGVPPHAVADAGGRVSGVGSRDLWDQMRAGLRAVIGRVGHTAWTMAPAALRTVLCAGALVPLIFNPMGELGLAVATFSSLGSNVLADVCVKGIDRLRASGKGVASEAEA